MLFLRVSAACGVRRAVLDAATAWVLGGGRVYRLTWMWEMEMEMETMWELGVYCGDIPSVWVRKYCLDTIPTLSSSSSVTA
jgi:hypothetical protein